MSSPYKKFEEIVEKLFVKIGFNDVKMNFEFEGSYDHTYEIDALFGVKGDATIVEIKYYRNDSKPSLDLLIRALSNLKFLQQQTSAENTMFVTSCDLAGLSRFLQQRYPDVEIWDMGRLLVEAASHEEIFRELLQVLEIDGATAAVYMQKIPDASLEEPINKHPGKDLSEILVAIKPGREMSRSFEDACIASLKYIFDLDLFGWYEQLETVDDLQRRDLVCRILPNSEVWRLMINGLLSRYVIFEFKNYTAQIGQHEILTTERYLYPTALRRVAIIISPQGCNGSATKVIQGAMREHGKLIISLTVKQLTDMLIAKDEGSDPNTTLFEVVDQFLMTLGR
jgi:hypothetical protein